MALQFTRHDLLKGAIIYASGDTLAALMLHQFMWTRLLGIVFIGATVYAFEIPNYFRWIEHTTAEYAGTKRPLWKTTLAILYFNPLWIARHMLFILFFSGKFNDITWDLLRMAWWSFVVNIPISFIANYLIQNKMPYKWRFFASATFSALMAIYYAVSMVWFN